MISSLYVILRENINAHDAYIGGLANDLNLRAGVLSFGFGPLRIGRNSEQIRHIFQNKFAHNFLMKGQTKEGPYWFRKLPIPASQWQSIRIIGPC
jgi:hypothetical protein